MSTLLTWSDRGLDGPTPEYLRAPGKGDRGPVLRLLDHEHRPYTRARVLTLPRGRARVESLLTDLRTRIPNVEAVVIEGVDPTDYAVMFGALGQALPLLGEDPDTDVLLSAGTPQAQTLWVILVAAGLLNARMLQVIPAAFVPDPHPHPVRVVSLDIDGFPQIRALREELVRLRARLRPGRLVGESEALSELQRRLERVALAPVPVLITGETGTGKELVARSLHEASPRHAGPFIAENCGAFDEGVLASELFGHERGAFTGAATRHRGLFEQAHQGTLFLDEVGELPPRVQAHLLRVLAEGVLRRVGGEELVSVDVRVVAATHRDLEARVRAGSFREDLYYRLRGAVLHVPPLRARRTDLEPLVAHFLAEARCAHLRPTREAWEMLHRWSWPGNVRELRAEVLRWTVFCEEVVRASDLSPEIRAGVGETVSVVPLPSPFSDSPRTLAAAVAETEAALIRATLAETGGNLLQTARRLDIDRNTLKRKLAALGLR